MDVGDVVLARVQEVDECHNVVLTMKGVGLRRLNQEQLNLFVQHIDRVAEKTTLCFNGCEMRAIAES